MLSPRPVVIPNQLIPALFPLLQALAGRLGAEQSVRAGNPNRRMYQKVGRDRYGEIPDGVTVGICLKELGFSPEYGKENGGKSKMPLLTPKKANVSCHFMR